MKRDKDQLPWWVEGLASLAGIILIATIVGGSAIVFFSFSGPFILLLLAWGGISWAWDAWRDHRWYKKHKEEQDKQFREDNPDLDPTLTTDRTIELQVQQHRKGDQDIPF